MRYRPRRPLKDRVLAEWRGYWEPQDVSKYESTLSDAVGKTNETAEDAERLSTDMNQRLDGFIKELRDAS